VVIDDGKVVAEGAHKSLLKTCPQYKQLYLDEERNSKLNNNE
jgi:ABC-type multidrug transport system fused ATPase/permease subunit